MKKVLPSAAVSWFLNYARKLEHPQLFKWICAIFLVNLFIPDPVPLVDELLLGMVALYLARQKKAPDQSGEKTVGSGRGERVKEEPQTGERHKF
ncbi:DUF6116 family protein [Microbulbifer hainanensis]|uniref:DUF6116 family protein n=1 Tax=Microbulbifer hainanensis TaxID=2735675 RepID=UPI001D02F829|nr:DUF6116 family protein [Microbulbifer hainanensis]